MHFSRRQHPTVKMTGGFEHLTRFFQFPRFLSWNWTMAKHSRGETKTNKKQKTRTSIPVAAYDTSAQDGQYEVLWRSEHGDHWRRYDELIDGNNEKTIFVKTWQYETITAMISLQHTVESVKKQTKRRQKCRKNTSILWAEEESWWTKGSCKSTAWMKKKLLKWPHYWSAGTKKKGHSPTPMKVERGTKRIASEPCIDVSCLQEEKYVSCIWRRTKDAMDKKYNERDKGSNGRHFTVRAFNDSNEFSRWRDWKLRWAEVERSQR